ncbi:hypothetical protein [Streptomyces sp. 7N604]|uniref:hypothetical protein n=1 Tax=Streptomyces sp. 7N604 TaxID=3457415 RepID=UPI003FD3FA23
MALSLYQIAVHAHDLPGRASFWCQVPDWKMLFEDPEEIVIGADENAWPVIVFLPVPEDNAFCVLRPKGSLTA